MYITITDIVGEKRINLTYPIWGMKFAIISMFSDDVQYWIDEPMKVLLPKNEEKELPKGVYVNKELIASIGWKLKSQLVSRDYMVKGKELEGVTEVIISLEKLENTDSLEDRRLGMFYLGSVT